MSFIRHNPLVGSINPLTQAMFGNGVAVRNVAGFTPTYLLSANFGASNHTFADGNDIETAASGSVQTGALTVVETSSGSVEILSNKLRMTGGGGWLFTGAHSGAITNAMQTGLLSKITPATTTGYHVQVFSDSATFTAGLTNVVAGIYFLNTGVIRHLKGDGAVIIGFDVGVYAAQEYQVCTLLGGYNSSGVPAKAGDAISSFTYGSLNFIKGGAFTTWTLLSRSNAYSVATVYASPRTHTNAVDTDDLRAVSNIAASNYHATVQDQFTDTNATAIASHDADVGSGGWVADVGTFTIESNALSMETLDVAVKIATYSSGISDVLVEVDGLFNEVSGSDLCVSYLAIRATDGSNYWMGGIKTLGTSPWTWAIYEVVAGTPTERASAAGSTSGSGSITLRQMMISNGTEIRYIIEDEAVNLSYSSATFNQTATKHGVRGLNGAAASLTCVWDNFAVFPISGYSDLDNYPAQ